MPILQAIIRLWVHFRIMQLLLYHHLILNKGTEPIFGHFETSFLFTMLTLYMAQESLTVDDYRERRIFYWYICEENR